MFFIERQDYSDLKDLEHSSQSKKYKITSNPKRVEFQCCTLENYTLDSKSIHL